MNDHTQHNDAYWREHLTQEQYRVLREGKTDRPFEGKFVDLEDDGTYTCAACKQPLFSSKTKFHSGSGWPSFYDVIDQGNVRLKPDDSLGMHRTEVVCANCESHLGHLFDDGPNPTGRRFCINSTSLNFSPQD